MIQYDNEYKNKIGRIMLNYRFDQFLNAGAFGAVFKGTDISNGNTVAIKLIKVESFDNAGGIVGELIVNEINIMKEIENDNVVKFFNYFQSTNYAYIIMEYCDGGDLEEYWKRNKLKFPPFEALKIMKQILNGMRGLHEKFIIHRDLKLANILIHEDVIKIADLGFSCRIRHLNDLQQLTLGTLGTMAPEVASGSEYGLEADVFSVGAIFYQLLFGHLPFDNTSFEAFLYDVRNRKPTFYKIDQQYDDHLTDILSKMLEYDRNKRITFAQIYDHPIMRLQAPRASLIDKASVKLNSVDFTKSQQFYRDNPVIKSCDMLPILEVNEKEQVYDQVVEPEGSNIDNVKVIQINKNMNNKQSDQFKGRSVQKIPSDVGYENQYLTPQVDSEGQKRRKIEEGCKRYFDCYNYIQTLILLSEDLQLVQYKNVYPIMYPRLQLSKLIYFRQYDLMDDIRKKKNELALDYIDEILETQDIKYIFERLYKEVAESKELYCQSLYNDLKSHFKQCQQYIDEQLMSSAKISFDKDFHRNFKTSIRQLRDYLYNQESNNVKQSDEMLRIILNITNLLTLSDKEFKQLYGRVKTMDINSLLNEVNNAIQRE